MSILKVYAELRTTHVADTACHPVRRDFVDMLDRHIQHTAEHHQLAVADHIVPAPVLLLQIGSRLVEAEVLPSVAALCAGHHTERLVLVLEVCRLDAGTRLGVALRPACAGALPPSSWPSTPFESP